MKVKYSLFIFLIFITQNLFAQLYSFSVNLNGQVSPRLLRAFQLKTTYIVLDDLIELFEAQHYFDAETLREEIFISNGKLFVAAYNPFLFFKTSDGKEISYQMFQPTEYRYGKIFVPLNSFSNFLLKYLGIIIDVNEKAFLISIRYEKNNRTFVTDPIVSKTKVDKYIETNRTENLPISIENKNFDLFDLSIEEKANGYMLRIKSRKAITHVSKNLSGKYLYLRIPNTKIDTKRFNTTIEYGIISEISSIQNGKDADIKLLLRDNIQSHEIVREKRTNDILLLLHVHPRVINNLKKVEQKNLNTNKKENLLDVIVIDPGHGGMDPGAIGYKGTREKDVNLGIALKLGNLIENNHKNIKVIYTRKNDTFVELYRRGQIANENNGKLFISIHCNSTEDRPGKKGGSEVYILRPGRTEDAIRVAEKENSVIKFEEGYKERYQFLSDDNFILTAMQSTANVKHSEQFASILSDKFEKHLPLKSNGVKQAGFYVLIGASMPSVLIETGYINNPFDENFLSSESGQKKIAEAIYKAIFDYKNYYDQLANK